MTTARGLTMVRASAGSGKTYRLTEDVCGAVTADTPVEGLVAVTFTTRAAAELEGRIRRRLVEAGRFDRAQRLPIAYVGTVHAVCLRLVQELALDAGLSPQVDVVPDEGALLREALEHALEPAFRARMDELALGLGVERDDRAGVTNWLWPVAEVMELARANRIRPDALPAMAERSAAGLAALLPPPAPDGFALDARLGNELSRAMVWLPDFNDGFKNTAGARATVLSLGKQAERVARLPWQDWLRLTALGPSKASADRFRPVIEAAAEILRHPAFHAELSELTRGIFAAARKGLEGFARWKNERGLVDFVEMIDQALTLLWRADVEAELGKRLRFVVVDEFQDTSPLQLALFTRLHTIAGRSTWVGDRKQCIFEFAGADPGLMDAVAAWAKQEGGATDTLPTNRRSRPELVQLTSAVFAAAMAPLGYEPDEVVTEPHRKTPGKLAALPPLGLWWLDVARGAEHELAAIAEGVRRLLESPKDTPVVDRATGEVVDLRPGDVAVLVDTNAHAEALANALAGRGIAAALARPGLLATPEGTLVDAALRWLLDARDTLSEAVLEALFGFGGQSADAWLAERIERAARDAATDAAQPPPAPRALPPWQARLAALRSRLPVLSPTEALDLVLEALDALGVAAAWPEPSQRRGNVEALRALAAGYEERCEHRREAATVAGLLRFFDEARATVLTRAGEAARDDQHVATGGHAVTVCTYHKAKGLEWPVVILASLDKGDRRTAFGVHPQTNRATFDPTDPLGGRSIRYWPRPFGRSGSPLVTAADASPEGTAVADAERHERVRLLYVGMTRARDHLILAARVAKSGPCVDWLDELADAAGRPIFALGAAAGEGPRTLRVTPRLSVAARAWALQEGTTPPARLGTPDPRHWLARPDSPAPARPGYRISPSRATEDWPTLRPGAVGEVVAIGDPLRVGRTTDVPWSRVGDAAHAFLACDDPAMATEARRERAKALLSAQDVLAVVAPETLLVASDRFRAWVDSRWSKARWHRELPVEAVVTDVSGTRRVAGTIDLLLETPAGVVLIDHKTSHARREAEWAGAAAEYGPQMAAYGEAIRRATGERVAETWLHFAVGGRVVNLLTNERA